MLNTTTEARMDEHAMSLDVVHRLKCHPAPFARVADGSKTFEVRFDDRGFQAGDAIELWEHDPARCPGCTCTNHCRRQSGRVLTMMIGYVFRQGFGIDLGQWVVLSLLPYPPQPGDEL